ncbi:MAG: hypothetical protein AAFR32_05980 [Pseudomonadota bacterium]
MSRSRFTPRFRTPRAPKRSGLLSWWNLWRVPTLVTIVAALWWFGVRPITEEQGWLPVPDTDFSLCGEGARTVGCVIDGDTLLISERGQRPRRIRLTGFDAPELNGACETERALARQARRRLLEWIELGPFQWNGAEDPPFDQYGRELRALRRVSAEGSREYLADAMIEAGLAESGGWEAGAVDWCQ